MFIEKVVRAFQKYKIPYCVVGGYAVALHGLPRGTVDIDFVVDLDEDVFIKIEKSLKELGLHPKLPITAKDVFQFRKEYIKNRNLIAWSFVNPQNPIELVDVLINIDLKDLSTITKKINQTKIEIIGLKDLIRIKKEAGRPQDLEDIKLLKQKLGHHS